MKHGDILSVAVFDRAVFDLAVNIDEAVAGSTENRYAVTC
jgi:hypothetical protein